MQARSSRGRIGLVAAALAAFAMPALAPTPAAAWWHHGWGRHPGWHPAWRAGWGYRPGWGYHPACCWGPPPVAWPGPRLAGPAWIPAHWNGPAWIPGHWS